MTKVILLEEDREGREVLAKILRMWGYNVIPAANEAGAHAALAACSADLILAGATYRDRLEFLSDLRTVRQSLPVIFLTDYCGPESRLRGLRYGAFAKFRPYEFFMNMRPVGLLELERLLRVIQHRQSAGYSACQRAA